MRKEEKLVTFVVRLLPSQVEFLRLCSNAAEFVREAVTEKMEHRRDQILARHRQELFGERATPQSPVSGDLRTNVIMLKVPNEIWDDAALKAKVDQGATLEELLTFLHSHLHPLFVDAVDGHLTSGECGTYSQESRQSPETKPRENGQEDE